MRRCADPDFGAMALFRISFHARNPDSPEWRLHAYCVWRGRHSPTGAEISCDASGENDPAPLISPAVRAGALSRLGAEAALRKEIAKRLLDLAIDWAESGDLPPPTEASFFDVMRVQSVDLHPDGLTFWYEETANIFAGHVIEVRCDAAGGILEAHLAG